MTGQAWGCWYVQSGRAAGVHLARWTISSEAFSTERQIDLNRPPTRGLAAQDPRVPRRRSVPSVGPVTAASVIAVIDDVRRFRHAHQLDACLVDA